MIKVSIHQRDITTINIYVPISGAPEYIKQKLIDVKREINSNTIIETNIPLSTIRKYTK